MKIATTILIIGLTSMAWLYYSLTNVVSGIVKQRSVDMEITYGMLNKVNSSLDSVRSRSDIAVSHLSRDNMERVIRALDKAKIVNYDSLTESYYGGFNVGVRNWNEGQSFDKCKFWAKVKINGELEIGDCMRDIHSDN